MEHLKFYYFYATVQTALPHPSGDKDEGKKLCIYTLIGDKYTKITGHFLCTSLDSLNYYICPLCLKCIGCFVKLLAENCAFTTPHESKAAERCQIFENEVRERKLVSFIATAAGMGFMQSEDTVGDTG